MYHTQKNLNKFKRRKSNMVCPLTKVESNKLTKDNRSEKVLVTQSCPTVTQQTVAHQASLSMGFSRQRVDCQSLLQRILTNPGIEPGSPVLQTDSLLFELQGSPKDNRIISKCLDT